MSRFMRLLALSVAVALGVALAAASPTAGQSAPVLLAQSDDGSLWLVLGGVRHRVTPLKISNTILSLYPEREPIDAILSTVWAGPESPIPAQPAQPTGVTVEQRGRCWTLAVDVTTQQAKYQTPGSGLSEKALQWLYQRCLQAAETDGERGVACISWAIRETFKPERSGSGIDPARVIEWLYSGCIGKQ